MSNSIAKQLKAITEPQIQFLAELREGKYLAMLSEPCDHLGDWIGCESFSKNILPKSIFKLKSLGLLYFQEFRDTDFRWDICRISKLGEEFLDDKA